MNSRRSKLSTVSFASAVVMLTVAIGLFGGASRDDVATNPIVQLFGIVLIFLVAVSRRWTVTDRNMRRWLALVALLTLWMAVQLVPLPPAIWSHLPARAIYVPQAKALGIEQPWRPISLSPMNTWASLVGMTVLIGLLLGWGNLDRYQIRSGRWVLAILLAISILLGLAQVSGGMGSGLYLFDNGSPGFPAGLFANRNHQAAALAMIFPLLGAAIVEARMERQRLAVIIGGSCIIACLVLPMLLVNGSRAGLALAALTIMLSLVMVWTYRLPGQASLTLRQGLFAIIALATPVIVAGVAFLLGRAAAIERLTRLRVEDDQRYRQAATVVEMICAHFPLGAGYGSFPQVFRVYEPFSSLKLTYFNHAHNDLIELAFEGGLPSVLLALGAAILFIGQAWRIWRTSDRGRTTLYARAATIMIVALVIASISDYPLRTPTIQVFAVIALAWLAAGAAHLKTDHVPL